MAKKGRPLKDTDNLIKLIQSELRKKLHGVGGYTKADALVRGLVWNALPKDENGQVVHTGEGKIDLKAAQFVLEIIHGKPTERRETTINIFAHYPEAEKKIALDDYKTIEVKAEAVQ